MGRPCLALVVLALLSISPALGQYSAVIKSCQWDSRHICGRVLPDGGQLSQCIEANFQALSEPCKAALVRIAAVRESCERDIQ
jgi:hypothetical protein